MKQIMKFYFPAEVISREFWDDRRITGNVINLRNEQIDKSVQIPPKFQLHFK